MAKETSKKPPSAKARERVEEDPLAHLRGLPNHAEIVEATRLAQEEAVARRDAGQDLVERGYTITGAEEDADGGYAFLILPPNADENAKVERAPLDRKTGKAVVPDDRPPART